MNLLEGRFSIRDRRRSSAFDGNSPVSFGDGVELQRKTNLLYPARDTHQEPCCFSCVQHEAGLMCVLAKGMRGRLQLIKIFRFC